MTAPFIHMDRCQRPFEMLKQALMSSPILVYLDQNKECILYMDISKYTCSTVLAQAYTTNIILFIIFIIKHLI